MQQILKLKHWQVFLFLMVWYVLYYIFSFTDFEILFISKAKLRAASGVIGTGVMIGWVMFIGLALNRINKNPYKFRDGILLVASIICILGYSELHLESINLESNLLPEFVSILLTPLTFLGILITYRTVSKSLKSIEKGEKARISEYLVDAVLLFVLPIGIWIIQPRLNKIYLNIQD